MDPDDESIVAGQLGRSPRGRCRVMSRCAHGYPQVIAVAPVLEDGTRFPTTFWLSCPHLTEAVHLLESRGEHHAMARRAHTDGAFAARMVAADDSYRAARAAEAGGLDPCVGVGVAGQADPLAVKCLHARLAVVLSGLEDPVGDAVRESFQREGTALDCPDVRCATDVASS